MDIPDHFFLLEDDFYLRPLTAGDLDGRWPHWFNDAGGPNPFGQRFNIRSIPATFLLGRDGRLVTTETHGAKLDAALQKLLGE